ncbi:hypothetical protein, partial [Deinococcus sp.]|uniref:hypothetical protein n=1 Tax=Deinococcus sp. TaxID=47478 RepID=UPI002869E2EF
MAAAAGGVLVLLGLWQALHPPALPPLSFPLALLVGVVAGTAVLRTPGLIQQDFTLLDAARLVDSHAQLCGLLPTVLTLPEARSASDMTSPSSVQVWQATLHERLRTQAHEAASSLNPLQVLP